MAAFEYKGLDARGGAAAGIVDADNAKSARAKLRKQGVFPTEIWEQKAGTSTRGKGLSIQVDFSRFFKRVRVQDVAEMTSQLSTLIGAGIPMVEALTALVDQVENPQLRLILVEVREKVNQGSGLAVAMKGYPNAFNDLYVSMVAAGEQSGALDIVLKRLTEYTEAQVRLRNQLTGAMMYPLLMGGVSALIVVGLFVGVIPRIRRIFDSFGSTLPLITRVLLGISDFVSGYWWAILIAGALAVWRGRIWLRTPKGRAAWHRGQLRMPIFGRINRLVAVSRFCRTLSTLLDSGVPILTAVSIVKNVVGNDVIAAAIEQVGVNIAEGESIAEPLRQSGQFPALVTHMISIGEKTGELEPMLQKVADSYDQQVEAILRGLTSLLEPILILVMGGVVTLVALSILLPMLNLSSLAR
jgi:general secretion pathway protein F